MKDHGIAQISGTLTVDYLDGSQATLDVNLAVDGRLVTTSVDDQWPDGWTFGLRPSRPIATTYSVTIDHPAQQEEAVFIYRREEA